MARRATAVAVPEDLDAALSPAWLTAALRSRFPGIEVRAVERGPVVERLSTNARFTIDHTGADDAPRQLCVKGYFSDVGRPIAFVGEPEACFYRDLALPAGVRTLRCFYADVHPVSRHGVVITRDEVAQGAEFLDGNSPFTVDQAASALTELARLHAATWMSPRWAKPAWLQPRLGRAVDAWGRERTVDIMTANLNGANGIDVPPPVRDAEALLNAHQRLKAPEARSDGWCVIHGDAHVGNIMVDAQRRPLLVDWQLVQRGYWQLDVGYLIAATLPPQERRDCERELLRHYLNSLARQGVAVPTFDEARRLLIDGMVRGFFLWAITTKVAPDVIAVLLGRLGTAVADHAAKGHL